MYGDEFREESLHFCRISIDVQSTCAGHGLKLHNTFHQNDLSTSLPISERIFSSSTIDASISPRHLIKLRRGFLQRSADEVSSTWNAGSFERCRMEDETWHQLKASAFEPSCSRAESNERSVAIPAKGAYIETQEISPSPWVPIVGSSYRKTGFFGIAKGQELRRRLIYSSPRQSLKLHRFQEPR